MILIARKEILKDNKLVIITKKYKCKLFAYIRKKKLEKEGYEVEEMED
jgi:vancomycin permeability regulator SanA